MRRSQRILVAIILLLSTQPAVAGFLDSPPPALDSGGTSGKVVYRMGPVHYDADGVDTIVTCSNLASAATPIAMDVFDGNDAQVGDVARGTVPAGGEIRFTTSRLDHLPGAVVLTNLPAVEDGKARISAATAKLNCTAVHRIRDTDGSEKDSVLELVKKVAYGD